MTWLLSTTLFVALLGAFVYASLPPGRWKIAAVCVFLALSATVFWGAFELLGKPKPIALTFSSLAGAHVYAYTLEEGQAIFLWISLDGEPLTLRLPWSTADAQSFQDAFMSAGQSGGEVTLGPKIDTLTDAPDNGEITQVTPPAALSPKS